MRSKIYSFYLASLLIILAAVSSSVSAQTFNGSTTNTAGNSSIPSTGSGGCGVEPQTAVTGGTRFNCAVAGVPGGSTLQSMTLNLTHTFDGDLDMYLISPSGAVLELSTDNGGGNPNYTNTVFRDGAATNITAGSAPFTGIFRPEGSLTVNSCGITVTPTVTTLAALGIGSGTWQLLILDDAGGDVGTMINWSLQFGIAAPPTVTCPANIVTTSSGGLCGAIVNYTVTSTGTPAPTITYSLTGATTRTGSGTGSGGSFNAGVTTVTVTATNGSGTANCSFTITVTDVTPPTITCPANITVNNDPNVCGAVVNYPYPTVGDNCALPGGTSISRSQSTNNTTIVPILIGCQYTFGQTAENSWWRAYDLAPANLPTGLTIKSVRIGVETIITATTVPVTARIYTSNGAFPTGTLTLRATQTVNLSSQSNTFVTIPFSTPASVPPNAIVVVEINVPDLLADNASFFLGSNNLGQSAPSYISAPACGITTPTDISDVGFPDDHIIIDLNGEYYISSPTLVQTAGLARGANFPVGTTTNTYRATDAAGLQTTCSFTVTVVDAQQPTFTLCPASVTRNTDAGVCYATYTPVQPTFTDNCAVTKLTWVMTGATTGSSPSTGINYVPSTQFQLTGTTGTGVTTITYTATDAAGNTRTCTSTITVNDASIPVITVPPVTKFVCVGSDAVFSVTASAGTGNPLSYQWQQWNGSAWVNVGTNSSTFTVPTVTFAQNTNTYRVVLTGRCSVVISNVVSLYINPLPVVSLRTSIPPSLTPGQSLNILSTVSPAGGNYVWRKDGVVIAGASSSSLTGLTVDDIGVYTLTYTDPNGCVTTSAAVTISGQNTGNVWVYPNPNYGQFQLRFYNTANETATVRVFDSKGSKVYERAVVTGLAYTQIDVDLGSVVNPGMYVVELVNGAGKRVGSKKLDIRRKP